MPPGNEGQLSDVDLDQKIAERSRAIALNQNDAKAYRDRGLLLARKREYDLAMSDTAEKISGLPAENVGRVGEAHRHRPLNQNSAWQLAIVASKGCCRSNYDTHRLRLSAAV
jgi:tetratricopeptide (TPR) repeat protein